MSSSNVTAGNAPNGNKKPPKRLKLRNDTFINPETGERSQRQISFRTSTSTNGASFPPASARRRSVFSVEIVRRPISVIADKITTRLRAFFKWFTTDDGHDLLKCSLAYILGSMATFWNPMSSFLGNRDGKHIVATITVYFHPARTMGSMLEAVLMAIVAVVYAELISLLSMAVPIMLRPYTDSLTPAHVVVLFICIGGGLGFVGWVKQRLNSPLSNVASTLASIAIISVVTKEDAVLGGQFSDDKVVQVLQMLIIGIALTAGVNILVWRKSARHILCGSIITCSIALGDTLSTITQGFLNGSEEDLSSADFARVTTRYAAAHTKMNKCLREVKFEQYFLGHEDLYQLEKLLVKKIESLARAIGGLRSASDTQFALLKEMPALEPLTGTLSPGTELFSPTLTRAKSYQIKHLAEPNGGSSLSAIDEVAERDVEDEPLTDSMLLQASTTFRVPSEIFEHFITLLGPSMKSLAWTLSEILLVSPFGPPPDYKVAVKEGFHNSLHDALDVFNNHRATALRELYGSMERIRSRSEKIQADIEEVAAACGHFSFSLMAVGKEMAEYLHLLDDLKELTESETRCWGWLKFWKHMHWRRWWKRRSPEDLESERPLLQEQQQQQPVLAIRKSAVPKGIPDKLLRQRDNIGWDASPQTSRFLRWASQKSLTVLRFLAKDDIRFGLKVAIGAVIYAALAFAPATRPTYMHWRGEWGLLSYMIVVSMTMGAANTTGFARFIGTVLGVGFSIFGWTVSQGNPVALALIGWMVGLICFYLVLMIQNAPLGRIALLAYNVIVLYAYSLSQNVDDDDDDEGGERPFIFEICYHRFVTVTLGILWGIVVCRVVWPISGRRKFREGLSVLYLQLGLIWKRGPLASLLDEEDARPYLKAGEQAALQRYAHKLNDLRTAAHSEFSLRGPFPAATYARVLDSTNRILDSFHAMKLITERRADLTRGERALLNYTAPEREQLCGRICHVFQVMASSLMLEYSLADSIPSVVGVKDRLLTKVYRFRKAHHRSRQAASSKQPDGMAAQSAQPEEEGQSSSSSSEEDGPGENGTVLPDDVNGEMLVVEEHDYALVYAYTLVTAQVAEELTKVRKDIEELFGVLHEEEMLLQ